MNNKLKVCLIQPSLAWEDIGANLQLLDGMLKQVEPDTDLVILPETFSTGFSMQSERLAEDENGKAVGWMKNVARDRKCHITGSMIYRSGRGPVYNRLYWISPEGIEDCYDKRHLFRPGGERENFEPGNERKLFTLGEFRILPQICYDLRFPVFSRNRGDYDVLIYVANWPASRQAVWDVLTRARAMENQCYVLAANRVGTDGTGTASIGGTCLIDPRGSVIQRLDDQPGLLTGTLDLDQVQEFRKNFPAWKDADPFEPGWESGRPQ